jgi:hypothetical protein
MAQNLEYKTCDKCNKMTKHQTMTHVKFSTKVKVNFSATFCTNCLLVIDIDATVENR